MLLIIVALVCFIIQGDSAVGEEIQDGMDSSDADLTMEDATATEEITDNAIEGRGKQRLVKGKLKLLLKAFFLFKLVLFLVSLPLSAIAAKIISWNAVALSLLAFFTSKLVLLRTLFQGRPGPTAMMPTPPIIIQSASDPVKRFRGGSRIYIQPDLNVQEFEEESQRRKRW